MAWLLWTRSLEAFGQHSDIGQDNFCPEGKNLLANVTNRAFPKLLRNRSRTKNARVIHERTVPFGNKAVKLQKLHSSPVWSCNICNKKVRQVKHPSETTATIPLAFSTATFRKWSHSLQISHLYWKLAMKTKPDLKANKVSSPNKTQIIIFGCFAVASTFFATSWQEKPC